MQKKLYSFLALMCLSLNLLAASPTNPATNMNFSSIDGGAVRVNWTIGNGARRIVIARQAQPVSAIPVNGIDYLADDDFGLGQELAPGEFIVYDGTGNHVDVKSLQPSTIYHFAVYEYNGTGAATEYISTAATGSVTTLSAPATQASAIVFSNVTGNSMKISWTNGDGNKRLVLAREGSPVNANPADLINYTSSPTFGIGAQIGSGNYVIYFSTGNTVTLTSLKPNTTYHFAVFEASGTSTPVFQTVAPPTASQATLPRPSVPASGLTFSEIDGNKMRLQWTKGNGSRRIIVAREGSPVDAEPADGVDYIPSTSTTVPFNTAPELAPGQKVVYESSGESADISGFTPNTTYYFKIFEYDGTGATIVYLTSLTASGSHSTASAPTSSPSNIVFSNVTGNSMKLTWTNGNGSRRIVIGKAGGPVDVTPADLNSYSQNAQFGLGTQLGTGNYVVYYGNSNTVTVTSLVLNQTYHFAVFEANGINAPVYNTTPAIASQATTDRPTTASSNLSFSEIEGNEMKLTWTSGNGQRRIVVVSENSPVTAEPVDGVDYLATTSSSFTTAPEILPGQKVVYDNTGSQATVTGLTKGTTYYYRIYEYSGTGTGIAYLVSNFASGSKETLSAPTSAASNVTFSNITGNAMTINWTNGNGSRRIVLVKKSAPVDAVPSDYLPYSASGTFGSGTQIGTGNYVVYKGNGTSVTITGLDLNTTYHVAVFECNGVDGPVYLTSSFATGSETTADRPTIAPSNMNFSLIDGSSMRVSWTNGNGTRRIVVVRAGSPVDAVPVDGVDYLAGNSAPFSTAPEIAPGQKVVYDHTNSIMDVTGLSPNTTYHFRVYEYSGTGTSIAYLTSSFAVGSKSTLDHPTLQASSVAFSSVSSTSMVVSWTVGDGVNRIVIAKKGAPVDVQPTDLVTYTASSNFGSGTQIGTGNYVVSKSNSTSVTVSNLTPGTTYYFAVFEFNGTDGPLYLRPGATGQATTIGPPEFPAENAFVSNPGLNSLQLRWANGSGNKRLVLMKEGAPVDATPTNNASYFANSFFGSGTEIGTGNFVVFNGIQDFVTVTNLTPGTVYHFAVFEYNDFGSTSQFNMTPAIGSSATSVLAVRFIEFKGKVQDGKVHLQWATAQEENSDRFEIQRSENGTTYTTIGTVASAGSSDTRKDYSFTDHNAVAGTVYYRIMEVDVVGKTQFSQVIRLQTNATRLVKKIVNPVNNQLQVELGVQPGAGSKMLIHDMNGRMVKQFAITGTMVTADVSALNSGFYVLEIITPAGKEKIKIVKQ